MQKILLKLGRVVYAKVDIDFSYFDIDFYLFF
jgi:hypothetical protein